MNETLKGLLKILTEGDTSLKCPVTQVLGALAPNNPQVVQALEEELKSADRYLSNFILDAFGSIGTEASLKALVDALENGSQYQDRIVLALSRAGEAGEEAVVQCWDSCDRETRIYLLEVFVRTKGPVAVEKLCEVLRSPAWSLSPLVLSLLKEQISSFPDLQIKKFRAKLGGVLRANVKNADPEVIANHLELLSQIGSPTLVKTLMKFASPEWPAQVRRTAIIGLGRVDLKAAELLVLFPFLREVDYSNVVGPVLDLLRKSELPTGAKPHLLALLDPKVPFHPQIRSYAIEAVSTFKEKDVAKALFLYLDHPEEWAHTRAARGLEGNMEARSALQTRLLAASGEKELGMLLRPLLTIGETLKPAFLRKAFLHMEELRAGGNTCWSLIREFLWSVNKDFVVKEGLTQARKLRQENSLDQTLDLLLTIAAGQDPEPALRYEIAIAQILKSHRSVAEPLRADPAMGHIQTLVEENRLDVLESLIREDQLKPDDLLYIGTHFIDRSPQLQEFGSNVLSQLVKKWPHSKSAKLANQKFRSSGIEPRA